MLKPIMPKFRPDLYARLRDMADKQVPAKLKPIVNRCEYWMWGVIEADPDAATRSSIDDLKDLMKSAFRSNKVTNVKGACAFFRDHTEKMVTASGGFIV